MNNPGRYYIVGVGDNVQGVPSIDVIHPEQGAKSYPATPELCRHAATFMYGYATIELREGLYGSKILTCVASLGPAKEER